MAKTTRKIETYTPETLAEFAREFVKSGDVESSYANVFGTRKGDYARQQGTLLGGRADVARLVDAERARVARAAAAALEPEYSEWSIQDQMRRLQDLVDNPEVSGAARVTALVRYGELQRAAAAGDSAADVPAELDAFLRELDASRSSST